MIIIIFPKVFRNFPEDVGISCGYLRIEPVLAAKYRAELSIQQWGNIGDGQLTMAWAI